METDDVKKVPPRFNDRLSFSKEEIKVISDFFSSLNLRKENSASSVISIVYHYFPRNNSTFSGRKSRINWRDLRSNDITSVNLIQSNAIDYDFEIFKTTDDWFYLAFSKRYGSGWLPTQYYKCDSIDGLILKLKELFVK